MEYVRLTKEKMTKDNTILIRNEHGDIVLCQEVFDMLANEHNRLVELEDKIEQGTLVEKEIYKTKEQMCDCYHTKTERYYIYDMFTGRPSPMEREVGVCWGTRERDQCKCGGNRKKCDFYEEVRNG